MIEDGQRLGGVMDSKELKSCFVDTIPQAMLQIYGKQVPMGDWDRHNNFLDRLLIWRPMTGEIGNP